MDDKTSKYIPLREAAKYCYYSQEYLSLRARQGKLKALKFGRNWVTTKEWLQDYLQKVGTPKPFPPIGRTAKPPRVARSPLLETKENSEDISGIFPKTLPGGPKRLKINALICLGLVIALILISVFTGENFSKTLFQRVLDNLLLYANSQFASASIQEIFQLTWNVFKEYGKWISQVLKETLNILGLVDNFLKSSIL